MNCRDCGHQVSKKSATCPNCGRRIAFGIVIFLAVFCASFAVALCAGIIVTAVQLANMH
jgi:hypothetical protein